MWRHLHLHIPKATSANGTGTSHKKAKIYLGKPSGVAKFPPISAAEKKIIDVVSSSIIELHHVETTYGSVKIK